MKANAIPPQPDETFFPSARYTANHKNLASYVGYSPPKRNAIVNGVGILRRVFGTLLKTLDDLRRRQAEREVAKFVALRGGRITDDLEREIMRRLFTSDWSPRG